MPIYEYGCRACGRKTEAIQRVGERPLRICPHCGGKLKKEASAPAIQFKGSGWYVTDYARAKKEGKKESASSESKESSSEKTEKSERKDSEKKDSERKDSEKKDSERKDSERKDSEKKDSEKKAPKPKAES